MTDGMAAAMARISAIRTTIGVAAPARTVTAATTAERTAIRRDCSPTRSPAPPARRRARLLRPRAPARRRASRPSPTAGFRSSRWRRSPVARSCGLLRQPPSPVWPTTPPVPAITLARGRCLPALRGSGAPRRRAGPLQPGRPRCRTGHQPARLGSCDRPRARRRRPAAGCAPTRPPTASTRPFPASPGTGSTTHRQYGLRA